MLTVRELKQLLNKIKDDDIEVRCSVDGQWAESLSLKDSGWEQHPYPGSNVQHRLVLFTEDGGT